MNVDGALTLDFLAGCGGVFRDENGVWLKGFCWNLGRLASSNVFLTELMAVKLAVETSMGLDFPRIIIESDSMEVVCLLQSQEVGEHHFAQIVMDILRMQADHGNLLFQHTPRECNSIADYLAKIGLDLPYGSHWFDSPVGECHSLLL